MKLKEIVIVHLVIVITIITVIGTVWVKNLIKLTKCDFKAPYKAEIIHTVGLFPPIGAVTGWLNLEDYEN